MATKPILLTVDDDPAVLRAVERDLRRHFGGQFRVLHADSGATALATLASVIKPPVEPIEEIDTALNVLFRSVVPQRP
jgi:CheY-like chemotaxis protein